MSGVKLRFSVKQNLKAIARYIARDNVDRALSFNDELMNVCFSLADFPKRGVVVGRRRPNIRRLTYGNYFIFYRYDETSDTVFILRICEHHQDMSRIKFED